MGFGQGGERSGKRARKGCQRQTAGKKVISVITQHQSPANVDGHYVPFELQSPKFQYRCFFASLTKGAAPKVLAAQADGLAPCGL